MQARTDILLTITAAAAALALSSSAAKALSIRYSFSNPSSAAYTGGTIDVASLDQTLGTSPVTFTVEDGSTYTVTANFSAGGTSSTSISYFTFSPTGSWLANNFNFGRVGSIDSTTKWRDLLGTFTGTSSGLGSFTWANSSAGGGPITASSITFSASGADVPGPLPLFGAAAAFGWSRRLRQRINHRTNS